eukprot:GFUD01061579.1.p1 GENE.GFUD01061579.1~~GFUD01061579.1.p1  ORF type:complete len:209 (+),score=37.73 GFUD01061579.1:50-628(+)
MVLAPRGEVAEGPTNGVYLEEGEIDNPTLDSAVDREVTNVNKEKQRRESGERKNPIKSKKKKQRNKIKISKYIKKLWYIHQSRKQKKTKNGNKKQQLGGKIAFGVEDVFDYIKMYSNYQNALRKGKRTATWFRMLEQKEEKAKNVFKNASQALEHATRNGTKCGNSPLNIEAKKSSFNFKKLCKNCSQSLLK